MHVYEYCLKRGEEAAIPHGFVEAVDRFKAPPRPGLECVVPGRVPLQHPDFVVNRRKRGFHAAVCQVLQSLHLRSVVSSRPHSARASITSHATYTGDRAVPCAYNISQDERRL